MPTECSPTTMLWSKALYLGIEIRLRKFWNPIVQTAERLLELVVDIIHVGVFRLCIGYQSLQGGILIEHQETVADVGISDGLN